MLALNPQPVLFLMTWAFCVSGWKAGRNQAPVVEGLLQDCIVLKRSERSIGVGINQVLSDSHKVKPFSRLFGKIV